jgi:aryl-alcohol dehydrogenase-like predicted oxidoreductase
VKLTLGTVQFGLNYGIANQRGQVPVDEGRAILRQAESHGMDMLDTAMAYGDSEQRLGEIGVAGWRVVSKLPAIPDNCPDTPRWVATSVRDSLERLHVPSLYGLLLHRPEQLLARDGERLYGALQQLKADGIVHKIGVSVYAPSELDALSVRYQFDLVQAPFSILDRRLISTGWLSRLSTQGIEVHVRSIFLQGLLLMQGDRRPAAFARWERIWKEYDAWLQREPFGPLEACLRFALSFPGVDRVIVGVDCVGQLLEILQVVGRGPIPEPPAALDTEDIDLLNPARWIKQ